jgi:hypothetical protein
MSRLGRRLHEYNASVDLTFTQFTATGRAGLVSSYLALVCDAVRDLPMDRLGIEAKILRAEDADPAHPAVSAHLCHRYGFRGVGLAGSTPPVIDQIEAGAVIEFVARHFTRDNAALALTGRPPDDLRLDLPAGNRTPLPPNPVCDLPLPGWFAMDGPATGLSLIVDADEPESREATLAVLRIATERAIEELRHRNGWIYHVDFELVRTPDHSVVVFHADPPAEHAEDVRRGLMDILRGLRDTGPTDAELADDLAEMRERFADPRVAEPATSFAASAHLLDAPVQTVSDRLALRETVSAEDCRQVLRQLESTLIVGMPPDVEPSDKTLHAEPEFSTTALAGRTFRRRLFAGLVGGPPRGSHLTVGTDGLTLMMPGGPRTIRWDGLVGAGRNEEFGATILVGSDCQSIPMAARWFHHGRDAMRLVDSRIPADLRFTDRATT